MPVEKNLTEFLLRYLNNFQQKNQKNLIQNLLYHQEGPEAMEWKLFLKSNFFVHNVNQSIQFY